MKPRVREHDEFLLSRLLDGDLPAEEAALLRERMRQEPELQACFEAMARVDQLLVSRRGDQPRIDFDRFHEQVLARLTGETANPPVEEADEFALSRLHDGDLSDDEASAIRGRLAVDAGLRDRLDSLAHVDKLLADRRVDQPDVDYSRLRSDVMQKVVTEPVKAERTLRFPGWLRITVPLAMAAAITLAVLLRPRVGTIPGGNSTPGAGSLASSDPKSGDQPSIVATRTPPEQVHPDQPEVNVAVADGATRRSPSVSVVVKRPGARPRTDPALVRVTYIHSDNLAATVRQADEQQRSRPPRWIVMASGPPAPQPVTVEGDFLDAAPL